MQLNIRERSLLGLGSILIGFLFIVLFKAQGISGSPGTRQDSTVPSLIQMEQENQQLSADNEKIQQELDKYKEGQNAAVVANQELKEAQMGAGLLDVTGPGIRITLDDSKRVAKGQDDPNSYYIHEQYIREIFNALWNGGAEAIAVNGQRVMTYTEVFCAGSYIQINGTRQMPPYIIEAIGDTNNLSAALNFYGWYRLGDYMEQYGITRKLEVEDKVTVPAGKLRDFNYAEPVKEES